MSDVPTSTTILTVASDGRRPNFHALGASHRAEVTERLVPVHKVVDLTEMGKALERELMLIKVRGTGDQRGEALRIADAFRARVIDATVESFVFELTGKGDKLDQFIELMRPIGLVEVSRTGVLSIQRGVEML